MQTIYETLQLLQEKLIGWLEQTILIMPNFVIALLIVLICYVIGRYVKKAVHAIASKYSRNEALNVFLSTLAKGLVIFLGIFLAINVMNLSKLVVSILAGVGVVGIALAFAFQDVASNFIAGIALVFRQDRPFKVGDIVETNDYLGIVSEINLRATMIKTFQGQSIFIPNKLIFENAVINYTFRTQRRIDLLVGVSYGDDLEKVEKVVLTAIERITNRVSSREPELYFEEFADSSINFTVMFWIEYHTHADFLNARHEAVKKIKAAFDANDITIPFPIRTLDFGIKGGEPLSAMIQN